MSEMSYRRLGNSGLVVSVVGIGCNNFGRKLDADGTKAGRRRRVRRRASRCSTPPTSTARRTAAPRRCLGAALKGRRDEVVLATKFGMDMDGLNGNDFGARGSRRYIVRAVEASLRRLDTDYIDLYQMHAARTRPRRSTRRWPRWTTWSAPARCATWATRTSPAGRSPTPTGPRGPPGSTPFISAQNQYSLLHREVETEVVPGLRALRAGPAAVLPAGQRPAQRQVPARREAGRGHPPVPRPLPALAGRRRLGHHRGADRVRGGARPQPARRGDRRPGRPAGRDQRDRRRDDAPSRCGRTPRPARGSCRPRTWPPWTKILGRLRAAAKTGPSDGRAGASPRAAARRANSRSPAICRSPSEKSSVRKYVARVAASNGSQRAADCGHRVQLAQAQVARAQERLVHVLDHARVRGGEVLADRPDREDHRQPGPAPSTPRPGR